MLDLNLWILYGVGAIFAILVSLVVGLMIGARMLLQHIDALEALPPGTVRAREASPEVLDALARLAKSVENMRAQNSAEHASLQYTGADTNRMVRRVLSRFGFLIATDPQPVPSPVADHA